MAKKVKFVPAQRLSGMQVIDGKGMLVGNVKDVSVNFHERSLAFLVTTKNRTELDVPWEDVMSVEDVVLLKKEIELPSEDQGRRIRFPTHSSIRANLSQLWGFRSWTCEVLSEMRSKFEMIRVYDFV